MIDALCIGHAAWDISVWVPEYPAENSKCEIREMVECSGGPAANAACLLAKWGVPTAFMGPLGRDAAGDDIRASFERFGVRVDFTSRFAGWPTPVSVITVNERNGSRTIVTRSAVPTLRRELSFDEAQLPNAPRLLLFDGHELSASLEAMERWPDALTLLDAGSPRESTRQLASRVKCVAASERFVSHMLGLENLRDPRSWQPGIAALHELNGNPVAITLGERGLIAGTAMEWFHLASYSTEPIDTTGAGDIFHGALGYSLLAEMTLLDALRMAAAASALSVGRRGSSPSIPTFEEVRDYRSAFPELAVTSSASIMVG